MLMANNSFVFYSKKYCFQVNNGKKEMFLKCLIISTDSEYLSRNGGPEGHSISAASSFFPR